MFTNIQEKRLRFYEPIRAYADSSAPLSLALTPCTAAELECLSRGAWSRKQLLGNQDLPDTVISVDDDDVAEEGALSDDAEKGALLHNGAKPFGYAAGDDQEVIGAVIKISRLTRIRPKPEKDKENSESTVNSNHEGSDHEEEVDHLSTFLDDADYGHVSNQREIPYWQLGNAVDIGNAEDDGPYAARNRTCPNVKAWLARHSLFSKFDQGIQLDESAWYEVNPEIFGKHIALRLEQACNLPGKERDTRPILAACCGVGGDAIQMAQKFDKIVCVDICERKIEMCKNNSAIYGVKDKMDFIVEDIITMARRESEKVTQLRYDETNHLPISIKGKTVQTHKVTVERSRLLRPYSWCVSSPPWGGPEYRNLFAYNLSSQTFADLIKIIQATMSICDNLCLILPRNQDLNEIALLAAYGSPDSDRFCYLECEKLTSRSNGYPLVSKSYLLKLLLQFVVVYICRTPTLFEAFGDPSSIVRSAKMFTNIDSCQKPRVYQPRDPLPSLEVADFIVNTFKKKDYDYKISVNRLHNVVFCRFLLGYLDEPPYQIKILELFLQVIGLPKFLIAVQETLRIVRAGGLKTTDNSAERTKGGVFFEVLKRLSPEVSRNMNKWRKKQLSAIRNNKQTCATTDTTAG